MIAYAVKYTKRCKACLIHADAIHQPPELLHPTVAVWPFKAWRIDIIGPISPLSARGHQFILVIMITFQSGQKPYCLLKLKPPTWSTSLNTMSSTDLVSLEGSSTTMVPNSQANYSIGSATSTRLRMWLQLLTTLLPRG